MIIYKLYLSETERDTLKDWVKKGVHKAKVIQQAQVLLGSDENNSRKTENELASHYHLSVRSVERIRKRFFEAGMDMFEKKERKVRSDKKIDSRVEAHLFALVCAGPREGTSQWRLQLLADKLVELQVVDHISSTMVGRLLKKNELKPFRKKSWVLPAKHPVVCLDESPNLSSVALLLLKTVSSAMIQNICGME